MPDDPIKTPKDELDKLEAMLEGGDFASQIGGNTPVQSVGIEPGKLGFFESLKRPGFGNNAPADLVKILAMGGAGAAGASPGGPTSALIGALLNFGQIGVKPDSLRPAIGAGNISEATMGPILGQAVKLPFVKKGIEKLPALTTGLMSAITGGTQTAADTYDRGGNVNTGGLAGGLLGLGLGSTAGKFQAMMKNLPSPRAQQMDRMLSSFSDAPQNSVNLNRSATNFLQDMSSLPRLQGQIEKEVESGGTAKAIGGVMNKAAAKKAPIALGQETTAAKKAAELAKKKATAKFLATDDVNDAKDYLQFDHLPKLNVASQTLTEATKAVDELDALPSNLKNFKWYKTRLANAKSAQDAAQSEVDSLLDTADQARQLTRRTEVSARRLAGQNVASDMDAAATDVRKANAVAERHLAELKTLETAGTSAKVEAAKSSAREGYFKAKVDNVLSSASLAPGDVTPNGWRFLNAVGKDSESLTLAKAIKTAVDDPEYAEGFRDLLLAKDPDMLKAVRSQYLYSMFEGSRSGRGGANFPKAYDGSELVKKINSQNPEAVNMFFGDPEAYSTIQAIAQSALEAEKLARPRLGQSGMHLALTGTGTLLFAGAGHLTNDPVKAGLLLALAGGGYMVLNTPRFMEALIQRPTVVGKAISAYIRSPNPQLLPTELTNALTGIAMPVAMPGTSDAPGKIADKKDPRYSGSITEGLQQ